MIDPKKALATADGEDHEELDGPVQFVHLAASPGSSPDQLAAHLQRTQWKPELALLIIPAFLFAQSSSLHHSWDWVILYLTTIWPALGLSLAWEPLRFGGKRSRVLDVGVMAIAFLQSLGLAMLLALPVQVLIERLLRSLQIFPYWSTSLITFLFSFVAGSWILGYNLSKSLVERELKSLPEEQIPRYEECLELESNLSPVASVQSLLGTTFRFLGWIAIAGAPYMVRNIFTGGRGIGGGATSLWWTLCLGFGIHQLSRGVFYLMMSRQLVATLKEKRLRLGEDTPLDSTQASKALVPLRNDSTWLAWSEFQTIPGLKTTLLPAAALGALSLVFEETRYYLGIPPFYSLPAFHAVRLTALVVFAATAGATLTPHGSRPLSRLKRMAGSVLALIPAVAFLWAIKGLWGLLPTLPWNYRPLLQVANLLAVGVTTERASALWAKSYNFLLGHSPPDESKLPTVMGDFSILRRATLILASMGLFFLCLGIFARVAFQGYLGSEITGFFFVTAFSAATLFAMRSNLAVESQGRSEQVGSENDTPELPSAHP